MSKLTANVVQETTATTGTGAIALTQTAGWMRFSDRFAIGTEVYYSIRDGNNWEIGKGTYSAANQLTRTTILETLTNGTATTGGSPLTLSGSAVVRAVSPEQLFTSFWRAEVILVGVNTSCKDGYSYGVTASGITLTLPSSPSVGDRIGVFQAGSSLSVVVVNPGAQNIQGVGGNMTIDCDFFGFTLVYVSASYGWKVL